MKKIFRNPTIYGILLSILNCFFKQITINDTIYVKTTVPSGRQTFHYNLAYLKLQIYWFSCVCLI